MLTTILAINTVNIVAAAVYALTHSGRGGGAGSASVLKQ